MYRANNIQSYFPLFSSQSCFYFAIRITKFVLKQGARTWATCTFVETISICHILLRYWPVSKANAWNSRWVQKLNLLFSISILWFHNFLCLQISLQSLSASDEGNKKIFHIQQLMQLSSVSCLRHKWYHKWNFWNRQKRVLFGYINL